MPCEFLLLRSDNGRPAECPRRSVGRGVLPNMGMARILPAWVGATFSSSAPNATSLPKLSFLPEVATKLYEAMTDPERGACQPALDPSGLVIDPTVDAGEEGNPNGVRAGRKAEMKRLSCSPFIGHGEQVTEDGDFYLLPTDAEVPPRDDTALNLVNDIKGLRRRLRDRRARRARGHVLLGNGSRRGRQGLAQHEPWRIPLRVPGGDRRPARLRRLLQQEPHPMGADRDERRPGDLRCEAVRIALADRCPNQQAQHVSLPVRPGAVPGA